MICVALCTATKYKNSFLFVLFMKRGLAALEVLYVVKEMQFLLGAKLEKIFEQPKPVDDFLFTLHLPGKGKQFVFVSLPKLLCLSSFKQVFPDIPPHFCMQLRKHLANARLSAIEQVGFERIISLKWSTSRQELKLFVELLPPGNMVLCDSNNKILAVLHPKKWSTRAVLPNKEYVLPPQKANMRTLSFKEFKELLLASERGELTKVLAMDGGFGGLYAKELVVRAGLDLFAKPSGLSDEQFKTLFDTMHSLFSQPLAPFVYKDSVVPFSLTTMSSSSDSSFETYNEALQSHALSHLKEHEAQVNHASQTKSSSKYEKIIQAQEAQLNQLQTQATQSQRKGELIYEQYSSLQPLLDNIVEFKKTASWQDVKERFAKHPLIASIDVAAGTITVDVDDGEGS